MAQLLCKTLPRLSVKFQIVKPSNLAQYNKTRKMSAFGPEIPFLEEITEEVNEDLDSRVFFPVLSKTVC